MLNFTDAPLQIIERPEGQISSFVSAKDQNIDPKTVQSFGAEWQKFNSFGIEEINSIAQEYFDIITPQMLNKNSMVLDAGCGSGRWSKYVASRAKFVEAIDPSDAVITALRALKGNSNIRVSKASIGNLPFADSSFDFILCLGVLHHLPNTENALQALVQKLKEGGHLLLYLYYRLDNRGPLFYSLFVLSNWLRLGVSKLPQWLKIPVCDLLAMVVYLPFVFLAWAVKALFPSRRWYLKVPLAFYVGKSLQVIRNDALDRFGTPLEQRFTKAEIRAMLQMAGLGDIQFSDKPPYWHVVAKKL